MSEDIKITASEDKSENIEKTRSAAEPSGEPTVVPTDPAEAQTARLSYSADAVELSELSAELTADVLEPDAIEAEFLNVRPDIIYHLSDFDGPLDLLLTLIRDAKIDIEEIFVSDVTRQYVEVIKNSPREELDFEYAGEFIIMASELVYLKSLRTLPKTEDDELDPEDPEIQRAALINKIKEYALIKEQSEKLKNLETINRFYRAPVYSEKDYRVSLTNFSLPKLIDAYARVLANMNRHGQDIIPKKVMKDRFSVHDQMENIRKLIALYKTMKFTDLFEPDYDKSDIVTTFLAVLELLKYGRMRAEQDETFGEITLIAVEGVEDVPIEFEEEEDGKY